MVIKHLHQVMFCVKTVTEETKDKITNLIAKVHMSIKNSTYCNKRCQDSEPCICTCNGCFKGCEHSDYNLITSRNCQGSTYIFLVINDKITRNGRHKDLEEWAKMGSPDTVILYLYWGSGQKPKKLWTQKRPLPQRGPPLTCRETCVISQFFFSFSVSQTRGIIMITLYLLLIHVHKTLGIVRSAECSLFCNNC